MKKLLWGTLILVTITGCKTSKHVKCDAYSMQDDIHEVNVESQKKFVTSLEIK